MNIVLYIQGGLGKVILSTAVIRSYKSAYPESKIVVVSGYPEVFFNNRDIYRFYNFSQPYLYEDYYSNKDYVVFAYDPYLSNDWIKKSDKHLIEIWCDILGVKSVQDKPLLFFSSAEVDELDMMIKTDKPLLVVQSSGGSNESARSWTRNPPLNELNSYISKFRDKYFVIDLCLPNSPKIVCDQRVDSLSRRQAMALIYYSHHFIGIDSFGMHTRAASGNKCDIFFILEDMSKRIGYKSINAIVPKKEITDLIKKTSDYMSNLLGYHIESTGENCPIPPGVSWFEV